MTEESMTPEQFCYWLNGHFDLNGNNVLSAEQVKVIREHLALVFNQKVDGIPLFETVSKRMKPLPSYFPDILNNNKPVC